MISNADIRYFTMPIPTSFETSHLDGGQQLYITQVVHSRNEHMLGTIVKVRKGFTYHLGARWRITEGGDYVNGHVVNNTVHSGPYIGKRHEDDAFWMAGDRRGMASPDFRLITHIRRSDGATHAETLGQREHDVLTRWIPAAPWALELLPAPNDTAENVRDKLALAKARWELNSAIAHIETEGRTRGWMDDLAELRANSELSFLPEPFYDQLIVGEALVRADDAARNPSLAELPESVRNAVDTVTSISPTDRMEVRSPVYPVSVTFPAAIRARTNELGNVHTAIQNQFQSRFRGLGSAVTLGSYEAIPYVGALSRYV